MPLLPTTTEQEVLTDDFEVIDEADLPTKTYKMFLNDNRMIGKTDGKDAMYQVIYKILMTERYDYGKIYGTNYGVELKNLIGTSPIYAIPEIERLITEGLTRDKRITNVSNFEFEQSKGVIHVSFTATTTFGDVTINDFEVSI